MKYHENNKSLIFSRIILPSSKVTLKSHFNVGRSLSASSWFWMSGDLMDFSQWDEGSHHSSACGGVSSVEPSTWRQRSCEEHLNFICFTGRCPAYRAITSLLSSQICLTFYKVQAPDCMFYLYKGVLR